MPLRLPEDFDSFWSETAAEAYSAPLEYSRSVQTDKSSDTHVIELIDFRGIEGETLHGWIAYPRGEVDCPSFLWLPPYGRWSMPPNEYGTREGFCSLSFNFFGETAFHEEAYTPARGYFADGAQSPSTWVYKTMLQNCLLAARVLHAQPESDPDRIAAMGMSQGGGFSIWLAGVCPIIKAVCADMPFLGDIERVLSEASYYRYPIKELTDFMDSEPGMKEKVINSLCYFDTVNQATRCAVPTLVSAGLKDPAVRPGQVDAIYDALPGVKQKREIDWGHDWHESMVSTNLDWLLEHL